LDCFYSSLPRELAIKILSAFLLFGPVLRNKVPHTPNHLELPDCGIGGELSWRLVRAVSGSPSALACSASVPPLQVTFPVLMAGLVDDFGSNILNSFISPRVRSTMLNVSMGRYAAATDTVCAEETVVHCRPTARLLYDRSPIQESCPSAFHVSMSQAPQSDLGTLSIEGVDTPLLQCLSTRCLGCCGRWAFEQGIIQCAGGSISRRSKRRPQS